MYGPGSNSLDAARSIWAVLQAEILQHSQAIPAFVYGFSSVKTESRLIPFSAAILATSSNSGFSLTTPYP